MALQTPQQKAANLKFAKKNVNKQGKPQSALSSKQSDITVSKTWLIILLFLVVGGGILELIRLFF